jgi:hypothetical protein
VGRNSKQRRDAKKRPRQQVAHRPGGTTPAGTTATGILGEGRAEEESTLLLLATAYQELPEHPSCDGPILIHQDGTFECQGTCENALKIFHDEDSVAPCGYEEFPTRHSCPRCGHLDRLVD